MQRHNIEGEMHGGQCLPALEMPIVMMVRNPIDIVLSRIDYYFDPKNTFFGTHNKKTFQEKFDAVVTNQNLFFRPLGEELLDQTNWINLDNCFPLAYEEFFGSQRDSVINELTNLLKQTVVDTAKLWQNVYGKSDTFAHGGLRDHKDLTTQQTNLILEKTRAYCDQIGYDFTDLNSIDLSEKRRAFRLLRRDPSAIQDIEIFRKEDFLVYKRDSNFYISGMESSLDDLTQSAAVNALRQIKLPAPKKHPTVLGLPRTGFSLTISILNHLEQTQYIDTENKLKIEAADQYWQSEINDMFEGQPILFNPNFKFLLGGPIWNSDQKGTRAYFRKYIGFEGHGDITLIISLPLEVLKYYPVIHSHGPFSDWSVLNKTNTLISTIRHPASILASSCLSLNALASEHLQKNYPEGFDTSEFRNDLAAYKLSDLKFFKALITPLKKGLIDYLNVRSQFHEIRFEELITHPNEKILELSDLIGCQLDQVESIELWNMLKNRNLTGAHLHNYRERGGDDNLYQKVLTPEHLKVINDEGLGDVIKQCGYQTLNEEQLYQNSEIQLRLRESFDSGSIDDAILDRELFGYAFNKSNLDFSDFDFKTFRWGKYCRIERSNLQGLPPNIEEVIAGRCDEILERIWQLLA
jgi:hypothetical protein